MFLWNSTHYIIWVLAIPGLCASSLLIYKFYIGRKQQNTVLLKMFTVFKCTGFSNSSETTKRSFISTLDCFFSLIWNIWVILKCKLILVIVSITLPLNQKLIKKKSHIKFQSNPTRDTIARNKHKLQNTRPLCFSVLFGWIK